jgi:hypothetical protein
MADNIILSAEDEEILDRVWAKLGPGFLAERAAEKAALAAEQAGVESEPDAAQDAGGQRAGQREKDVAAGQQRTRKGKRKGG